jgi:hypothetical protein
MLTLWKSGSYVRQPCRNVHVELKKMEGHQLRNRLKRDGATPALLSTLRLTKRVPRDSRGMRRFSVSSQRC